MKFFVVLASFCAVASAGQSSFGGSSGGYSGGGSSSGGYSSGGQGGSSGGYSGGGGSSSFSSGSGGGFSSGSGGGFSSGGGGGSGFGGGSGGGGQVRRFVSVHVAPDDAADTQSRVIRVPGGGDKHVNIIFVKAPSASSSQQTEVILPEQNEQKTLVYVLLKKGESNSDVKIRAPAAARPSKPEVFFIRYKNAGAGGSGSGSGGSGGSSGSFGSSGGSFGASSGGSGASSSYGVPPSTSSGGYN